MGLDDLLIKAVYTLEKLEKIKNYVLNKIDPSATYYHDPKTGKLRDYEGNVVYTHQEKGYLPQWFYKNCNIKAPKEYTVDRKFTPKYKKKK